MGRGKTHYLGFAGPGLGAALILATGGLSFALAGETGVPAGKGDPARLRPLRQIEIGSEGVLAGGSEPVAPIEPETGFRPLPLAHEFTSYSYENEIVFKAFSPPERKGNRVLDVINLGGSCPTPPLGVKSVEYVWYTTTPPPHGLRVLIKLWSGFDPAPPSGQSVLSGLVGGVQLDYGPVPKGTWTDTVTLAAPWYPSHADNLPITIEFTDNVAPYPVTSSTALFAMGPPIGPVPPNYPDPPTGSSENWYYSDSHGCGFCSLDGPLTFYPSPPLSITYKANFYLHLGGFPNPSEVEPNDSLLTANNVCACTTTSGSIGAVGDTDYYRFRLDAPGATEVRVGCTGPAAGKVTLLDSGGVLLAGPITGCPAVLNTGSLGTGTYYFKVESSAGGTLGYSLVVTPITGGVTGLRFSTATVPAPKSVLTWDAMGAGSLYDIVRGRIGALHGNGGDFADPAALTECWGSNLPSPTAVDTTVPSPGAAGGLFYLSRARGGCGAAGTYNEGGNQFGDRDPGIATNPQTSICP